jgi:GTPase Era involved in 16S rRNA processing
MTASDDMPRFAVVGHPNKGKSSIVATLAQDDSVYIDRISGSTRLTRHFPMQVDGQTLYELIDTPGFQRARAALAWLEKHCSNVSERPQAVRAFCEHSKEDSQFFNECELLQPLIEGAGIIYVVDGSHPYGPEYEAEMEILRWTGQPSLALINPIDNDQYVEEWEIALGQYFKTVRVFNAHTAPFDKRISLLTLFGQLRPQWQTPLEQAVSILQQERQHQHQQASQVIAEMLIDILQHRETQRLPSGMPTQPVERALAKKYRHHLANREKRSRKRVEEIYAYFQLEREEENLDVLDKDLFDQQSWYLFGLNKNQLVSVAAAAGASAGAVVDMSLGGTSLLLGSIAGGLVGGLGAWSLSDRIAKLSISGLPTGGVSLQYGPWEHPNFPFVVLGRALRHQRLICTRTHANRNKLSLQEEQADNPFEKTTTTDKARLMNAFKEIRKGRQLMKHQQTLANTIYGQIKGL